MSDSTSGLKKGCRIGCVGCLGMVLLMIVIATVVTGIAWHHSRTENIEQREVVRDLGGMAAVDQPFGVEALTLDPVAVGPAGRVVLDFSQTSSIEIRPGNAGEPAHVEATFDTNYYELSERLVEGDGGGGWTYEVRFSRTSSSYLISVLKRLMSGSRPKVVVSLPPDTPYDLEIRVAQGGGEVELGGLWLTDLDITFLQGGGALEFSEPLRTPIENISVDFTQGGGSLENLGNASPRNLDITFSMGGGAVDLTGHWQRDAHIAVTQNMGGVTVFLPDNVHIRGIEHGGIHSPDGVEVPLPVLTIETSSRFGELEIID